jgi:hypothetical protein
MAITPREMVYDTGFVVDGVALGFLCKTNSKIAYIDQVATKPGLPEPPREKALRTLLQVLEAEAKRCGFWMVAAMAGSANMQNRFTSHGFSPEGHYTLVTKSLLSTPSLEYLICLGLQSAE